MRSRATILIITSILAWASLGAPALAGRTHAGMGYREALAYRAALGREQELRRAREREQARQIAYFSGMFGPDVGRWYPLVHRYFPGYERDALYVVRGESGGDPDAGNGLCFGLFQIHRCHAAKFATVTGSAYWPGVFVARLNVRFAAYMSNGGRNWSAWTVRP